jgi:hypothetical protein
MRSRAISILFATLLVSGSLALIASSASALSYGVAWGNYDPGNLEYVKRSGASVYRLDLDYACTKGGNWAVFDSVVEAAWQRGITILPVMVRSLPKCESASAEKRFLNSSDPDWGPWWTWAKQAVERYGVNGSFWAGKANPTPITAWEVGNEPNLKKNNPLLPGGGEEVQAEEYGAFLVYTAAAIQTGSKAKTGANTQVLFGGLLLSAGNAQAFLKKAYQVPGVPSTYTGLSVHPYSLVNGIKGLQEEMEDIHNVLKGLSGSAKSLWITELGWPVGGTKEFPSGGHAVGEPEQASLLKESFNWIKGASSNLGIENVTWYNLQDWPSEGNWAGFCGLRGPDGSFRPAWFAFQEETGAPRWPVQLPRVTFSDAASSNAATTWTYGNGSRWDQLPFFGDEIAKGTHPSTILINGQPHVFFVDATHNNSISDWNWNPTTGWQLTPFWGDQAAPGSSPSAAMLNGTPHVFFNDATKGGSLSAWIWNGTTGWGQMFLPSDKLAERTSPSAAMLNGTPHVFFNDATDNESLSAWTWTPSLSWTQMRLWGDKVAAGTSPSAAMLNGTPHVFFNDATDNESLSAWTWTPSLSWTQMRLWGDKVAAGTSPSTVQVGETPSVFFNDATDNETLSAWTWTPSLSWTELRLRGDKIAAGTSPSGVSAEGQPHVFIVDSTRGNTITDWNWNPSASWHETRLGGHAVSAGTSPGGWVSE